MTVSLLGEVQARVRILPSPWQQLASGAAVVRAEPTGAAAAAATLTLANARE